MKLSKKDEQLLRRAYRHFFKMEKCFKAVKAPISEASYEYRGESYYAGLHENGSTEDEFIEGIRVDLEKFKMLQYKGDEDR